MTKLIGDRRVICQNTATCFVASQNIKMNELTRVLFHSNCFLVEVIRFTSYLGMGSGMDRLSNTLKIGVTVQCFGNI